VGHVALERWQVPGDVARWLLDLDNIRAEIRQQASGIRPGEVMGEVQDYHVIECLHALRLPAPGS
jgi:hypothetical protein